MRSPEASPKPLLASVEAAWQHEGSGGLGESVIQREHQTIPRFAQYSQPLQTLSRRWRQGIRRLRRSALPRPTPGVLERLGLPAARGRILPIVMLALINISACTTSGFLQVSGTQPSAFRPAVTYDTKTKQFLVAYPREIPSISGTPAEIRLRRFDVNGKGLGSELQPFGTG